MLVYFLAVVVASSLDGHAHTSRDDSPEALRRYVPELPSVKGQYWQIDPNLGYAVRGVGGGVYVVSDNRWQSAFLVTDEGVIVFDAPASFGKSLPSAIAKVTDKPIKMLIYSHVHKDHLAGSVAFKDVKGLKIVALDTVADFLSEMSDPQRLLPNETFASKNTVTLGGRVVELSRRSYHSNEGDLLIFIPHARFLMAVDSVTPGYAPFEGFDLTTNFHQYLRVFDQLLAYDFDTFVGGHLTSIGTRRDVEIAKEYTLDVYNTVKRIHNTMDQSAVVANAVNILGSDDNEFLLFKILLDKVAGDAVKELQPRWIQRLAGVDVWLPSHVRTALVYVRWDDKE
jgi:glyoxylase-like metal-dependent hydrolase (beta-lactamase superfamily II)